MDIVEYLRLLKEKILIIQELSQKHKEKAKVHQKYLYRKSSVRSFEEGDYMLVFRLA